VGHTGFIEAAMKAAETVDTCMGRVVKEVIKSGGISIITADHGNAEEMICPLNHGTLTSHSTSKVPFIICSKEYEIADSNKKYKLRDIAPTILYLLDIEKPDQMTGSSIVV